MCYFLSIQNGETNLENIFFLNDISLNRHDHVIVDQHQSTIHNIILLIEMEKKNDLVCMWKAF